MSGAKTSKTRFGFAGDGPEPPGSDQDKGARTVIGRELHLQVPPGFVPKPSSSQASSAASDPSSQVPSSRSVTPSWSAGSAAGVAPEPVPCAPTPRAQAAVREEIADPATAELPSRRSRPQGPSRLARFLGRWTKSGRFVSEVRPAAHATRDEDLEIPRDPLARNLVLVLLVASVTFLLTLVAVKTRQHLADKPAPAAASPAPAR